MKLQTLAHVKQHQFISEAALLKYVINNLIFSFDTKYLIVLVRVKRGAN